jgi:hypothetical protein
VVFSQEEDALHPGEVRKGRGWLPGHQGVLAEATPGQATGGLPEVVESQESLRRSWQGPAEGGRGGPGLSVIRTPLMCPAGSGRVTSMAISEKARHDLYNRLTQVLGEEPAETLMTAVPAYDPSEI